METHGDWLQQQRATLAGQIIDAPRHHRILVVGRKVNGTTDIVACLERALRNLGHHVVFLDLKKHPKIVDNPHRAQGGNGPIYLRLDDIRGSIQRFQPQVLLCLAGGLALQEEDATWLRAQGVVTIGITLSDPDVFDSVSNFAGTFDFHTTNALAAVDMYNEAGVTNTLHFPFGVDRAFVSQEVAVPDAYAADVICLGHATAHPVRDSVMSEVHERLANRFTVKAYGRGWSLPGARPVEGTEVLQASRGGLLHVNFPMTRAGYTNVKCGVFETVAGGGILVTQRFDEMGLFFDYDTEIGGYDALEDLPDTLEALLLDRAAVQQMRRRAFERLVREHLYEHRFLKLFADIDAAIASPETAGLSAARAGEIAEALSADHGRARIIALSGFYGARNLGDDLIMEAIAGGLESRIPGAQTMIVAQNPGVVELTAGRQSVSRNHHHAVDAMIAKADAFILGGGGLWHDYTFQAAGGIRSIATGATISIGGVGIGGMLAHIRSIPFHVVGLGVGPLTDPEAAQLVRFAAGMTDSLMVRDESSREILEWSGVPSERIDVDPDVVHSIELGGTPPQAFSELAESHFILGLNLRPWSRGETSQAQLVADTAAAIRAFAGTCTRPVAVALLPMQEGPTYDRAVLQDFADKLEGAFPILTLPEPLAEADFIGALKVTDLLVSMRLHSCLLAHRLGRPVVGLAYDPKLHSHFIEMERLALAAPLDIGAEGLCRLMRSALDDYRPEDLAAVTIRVSTAATDALARVAAQIAARPARRIIWGIDQGPVAHETRAAAGTGRAGAAENDTAKTAVRKRRSRIDWMGQSLTGLIEPADSAPDRASFRRGGGMGLPADRLDWGDAHSAPDWSPPRNQVADRIDELLEEAQAHLQRGDLEAARAPLDRVRQMDPDNRAAIAHLLHLYLEQQNWSRLTFYIKKASYFIELHAQALEARISMYVQRDKQMQARKLLDQLPATHPLREKFPTQLSDTPTQPGTS